MAPPSSSSVSPSLPPRSHLFTPIQEGNESEETEERHRFGSATTPSTMASSSAGTTTSDTSTTTHHHRRHHQHQHQHQRTPLHEPSKKTRKTPQPSSSSTADDRSVSCTNCRPNTREKTSVVVVPVDNKHHHHHNHSLSSTSPSPNGLFKSLIAGISRRSPKPSPSPSPSPLPESSSATSEKEAILELSHKLVQATRRRDEAILEASKLKYSMSELEKKLNRLEIYCHNLKSGLDICNQAQAQAQSPMRSSTTSSWTSFPAPHNTDHDLIIKNFLSSVSDARSSIRFLSKSLCSQLKLMGLKVFERLSAVLKSYDFKLQPPSSSTTSSNNNNHNNSQYKSIQVYLEALLSAAFFEDFEGSGFVKNSTDHVLNPIDRCEVNYTAYSGLKDLQWEEVLSKGTKHFSEEFSRYCDRKMSEIVSMLGWNRAWPEQLLQAFFGASKSVWLVHLLANSVHPRLSIFRVDKGVRFDPIYMDDMGGDKAKKLIPTLVRIMVAPGFYVSDNVVKCKVICRYYNTSNSDNYTVFSGSY